MEVELVTFIIDYGRQHVIIDVQKHNQHGRKRPYETVVSLRTSSSGNEVRVVGTHDQQQGDRH
jgi:hypothetical protein